MCVVSGGTYAYLHMHISAWGECVCLCVVYTCVFRVSVCGEHICVCMCSLVLAVPGPPWW